MKLKSLFRIAVAAATLIAGAAWGQAPVPYGAPVSLEMAKKAAAATAAEARKNGWLMAIAVTEPSGDLVYFLGLGDLGEQLARFH